MVIGGFLHIPVTSQFKSFTELIDWLLSSGSVRESLNKVSSSIIRTT